MEVCPIVSRKGSLWGRGIRVLAQCTRINYSNVETRGMEESGEKRTSFYMPPFGINECT